MHSFLYKSEFPNQEVVYVNNVFNQKELDDMNTYFHSSQHLWNDAYGQKGIHRILPIGQTSEQFRGTVSGLPSLNINSSIKLVCERLHIPLKNLIGDNWYQTDHPYGPHADAPMGDIAQYLHVVVPVQKNFNDDCSLIVFDQATKIGTVTITGEKDIELEEGNEIAAQNIDIEHPRFSECKSIGFGSSKYLHYFTNKELDPEICKNYLDFTYPQHSKERFFGLSCKVYKWVPGDIILFNSSQIHASGRMPHGIDKHKLGITMLFKFDSVEECQSYKLSSNLNFKEVTHAS